MKKILAIMAIMALSVTMLFSLTACAGDLLEGDTYGPVEGATPVTVLRNDDGSYKTEGANNEIFTIVQNPNDRNDTIDILQLTDIHIGGGNMSIEQDQKALKSISNMVRYSKPDFIVVTGDIVYPVPYSAGTNDNEVASTIFIDLMDSFEIPYSVTFGNHDVEEVGKIDKLALGALYEASEYCVFASNLMETELNSGGSIKTVQSVGNYAIQVIGKDIVDAEGTVIKAGEMQQALVIVDSNMYGASKVNIFDYDIIHDVQIEWYEDTLSYIAQPINENGEKIAYEGATVEEQRVNELSAIASLESLIFYHIPINAYRVSWDAMLAEDPSVVYYGGELGETNDAISCPSADAEAMGEHTLWNKMLELGSTEGSFVGHDHMNDFSIGVKYDNNGTDKEIRLSFGKSIDYLAYTGGYLNYRGGTMISLLTDEQQAERQAAKLLINPEDDSYSYCYDMVQYELILEGENSKDLPYIDYTDPNSMIVSDITSVKEYVPED